MKVLLNLILLLSLCLTGCIMHQVKTEVNRRINVFGIEFYSGIDYQEISGVKASEEPCLRGYERSFDQLEITIGYGFDKKIRKITTRNPKTSIFDIVPGMPEREARRLAEQTGFQQLGGSMYRKGVLNLSLLISSNGKVFGVSVEQAD